MRDRRSTDDRAKRGGIKIEKNWAENEALGHSAGKRGWRKMWEADVRDERYEVNHCSEREVFITTFVVVTKFVIVS